MTAVGSARSLRLKTSSQKTSSHIATQRSLRNSCPFGDPLRTRAVTTIRVFAYEPSAYSAM
jgi:hypothetical protein